MIELLAGGLKIILLITAIMLSLLLVLTGVGIYFAVNRKKLVEPEAIVNPLDFSTDFWDGESWFFDMFNGF